MYWDQKILQKNTHPYAIIMSKQEENRLKITVLLGKDYSLIW